MTLQFTSGIGLSRLDAVYSSGNISISGFVSDPGFVDPTAGSSAANYSAGVLTFTMVNGGVHAFYFTNRTASAGQTLRIDVDENAGSQFGVARIGYANVHTLIGPDVPSNVSSSYSTADGRLILTGYADTPGTVPANLYENVDWFGISGGNNNEAIEGAESLNLQFSGGTGLTGIATRYTSGQVVLSGFTADPGLTDPSGIATAVNYSGGTLSYTFNAPHAPEVAVGFTNVSASAGQMLSLHTDGSAGSQIALTRFSYDLTPVYLSIAKSGNNIILSWPNGTLQQSTNVSGSYSNVLGATSPYTNAIIGPQKYFRVKVQ
jgi:hypothetical protein